MERVDFHGRMVYLTVCYSIYLFNTISHEKTIRFVTLIALIALANSLALWYEDSVFKRKMNLVTLTAFFIVAVYDSSLRLL